MTQPRGDELRRAAAGVISSLAATFGVEQLDLIEDAAQDAVVAVLHASAHGKSPADLAPWLYRVAHNRLIDRLRQSARHEGLSGTEQDAATLPDWREPHERDSELHMLLMCCHPCLPPIARVALSLSVVAGFKAPQIARSFLMSETATRQVLVRAKKRLRECGVKLSIESPDDIDDRLDAALATIYLIFNEGYFALDGDQLTHPELCGEAIRMCGVLLDEPRTARPETYALAALLFFQMARLRSRIDDRGDAVLLSEQDRSAWDRRQFGLAFDLLARAASGTTLTPYHIEAEIASYHARASKAADTDWDAIVQAYDVLAGLNPSPIVLLNRAIAIGERDGPGFGLRALDDVCDADFGSMYPFYQLARGTQLQRLGRDDQARQAYHRALALAASHPVRRFIRDRLEGSLSKTAAAKRV